jgi:hypothetical protein
MGKSPYFYHTVQKLMKFRLGQRWCRTKNGSWKIPAPLCHGCPDRKFTNSDKVFLQCIYEETNSVRYMFQKSGLPSVFLKGLSHEIFRFFWLEWIYLGLIYN